MCRRGWLGHKSGSGFYHYKGDKKKGVHAEAVALLPGKAGGAAGRPDPQEARERLVVLQFNEAAACLGEGLTANAETLDLAMVLGTGWAPHRGGPLRYADDRGAGEVVTILEDLARRIGPRFDPCAELRRRAGTGEKFYPALDVPPPA